MALRGVWESVEAVPPLGFTGHAASSVAALAAVAQPRGSVAHRDEHFSLHNTT
jgi:hypothetical protein